MRTRTTWKATDGRTARIDFYDYSDAGWVLDQAESDLYWGESSPADLREILSVTDPADHAEIREESAWWLNHLATWAMEQQIDPPDATFPDDTARQAWIGRLYLDLGWEQS